MFVKNRKKSKKGFTLIELIIAIAILVILTGLLAPQFMKYIEKSRRAKAMQQLDNIYSVLQVAYIEVPQSAKMGDGDHISFGSGVPLPTDDSLQLYTNMKDSLGENEMEKIRIDIIIARDGEDALLEDQLEDFMITYRPDVKIPSNFYFLTKGSETADSFGAPADTYGEYKDTQYISWK